MPREVIESNKLQKEQWGQYLLKSSIQKARKYDYYARRYFSTEFLHFLISYMIYSLIENLFTNMNLIVYWRANIQIRRTQIHGGFESLVFLAPGHGQRSCLSLRIAYSSCKQFCLSEAQMLWLLLADSAKALGVASNKQEHCQRADNEL